MARIHARVRGKSGSTRPFEADLSFVALKSEEVESLVLELFEKNMTPSVIGMALRDSYGVPSVKLVCGKSITQILNYKEIPEDLAAIVSRIKVLRKHLETNTRDTHNKRGLRLLESKLRRLSRYYKRVGRISSQWSV